MSRIIEIVGPSGIGKSTVYSQLKNKWNKTLPWLPAEYALSALPKGPMMLADKLKSFEKAIRNKPQPQRLQDAELRFIKANQNFAETVWELIDASSGKYRLTSAHWFLHAFRKWQAITESNDEKLCLLEEGLVSKLMHVSKTSGTENLIGRYASLMPAPHLVIYLTASSETIAERVSRRTRLSTVYEHAAIENLPGVIAETQDLMKQTLTVLEGRGIRIEEVDATHKGADEKIFKVLATLS